MRKLRKPLVAIVATACIAIAGSALAVHFDGYVYQVVRECEVTQEETAWGGDDNFWTPGTPKTNTWGSGFTVDCNDLDEPFITGFYAGQQYEAGQVIVSKLPDDAHGVEVTIVTDNGWALGKTHVYAGHTPPPTNPGGKLVPGRFPQSETFDCEDQVTYASYTFEYTAATALQVKHNIRAAGGDREWKRTRNALKREWKFSGRPQPWKAFLKSKLIGIAQDDPDADCVIYVAVHAEVCRCEPTGDTTDIVPLAGAVVEFRSLNKNGVERVALANTDADGYYYYDTGSGVWDVAGYFTDTDIRLITPAGLVIPDVSGVVLEAHPEYQGTQADLYANFTPQVVGQEVFSPNEGANAGETKAAKGIYNVDFSVLPY